MHRLRFRQVHLDFHTSGDIPGIGEKFSKRQFQEALKVGRIDSITLFSKCHHGWSYHPTKVGARHPHLKTDLLARQIEACREIDVRCPIYLSAGVDERAALEHPEWVVKQRDGRTYDPLSVGWFKLLRFNSAYLDLLCAQIEEVVTRWPDNDGIFLDIVGPRADYSEPALREMQELGLDPEREGDVATYAQLVLVRYYERANAAVARGKAETPVFHNAGHVPVGARRFHAFNSHLELESLPTGGWGYDHFPFSARYAATVGCDYLGMTGKFHTTWGEFGGFKRPEALRYECGAMLAYGAKCSIGDQLHPNGVMNADTYRIIGEAYADVEKKEPWCQDSVPITTIGLVSAERNQALARGHETVSVADQGAARMLFELHLPFLVLDETASWKGCDLVVLPDGLRLTSAMLKQARAFLKGGGRIVAAGSALLNPEGTAFAIDPGATLVGRSTFDPDFLVATELSPAVSVRSPIVIHGGAFEIKPSTARVFAERRLPYFNRTWRHFSSHQHAPDAPKPTAPAAVITDQIAYFAHDLFSRYREHGQPLYRDFFADAVRHVLRHVLPVETNLPPAARVTISEQPARRRYVVHIFYAATRIAGNWAGRPVEIIDGVIPLRDVLVNVRLPRKISAIKVVPSGVVVRFVHAGNAVTFKVPEVVGHQMVELSYA